MILILFYDFKKYLNVSAVRTLDHHDKMRGQLTLFFKETKLKILLGPYRTILGWKEKS